VDFGSDLEDDYSGNPHPPRGPSPWQQVLDKMAAVGDSVSATPNTRIQYGIPVGACGILWSNFHYLVLPPVVSP
jgi:hypothetical protein